jgi:hypothetical protein
MSWTEYVGPIGESCIYNFERKTWKDHLKDLGADGRIIIKLNSTEILWNIVD